MARERALVHVAGRSGSGKTTLIERLLESNRSTLLMVARAERDGSLDRVKETAKKTDPELRRYAAAGASDVTRYRFPESDSDAFF